MMPHRLRRDAANISMSTPQLHTEFFFDAAIYTTDDVLKAAYRFLDRFTADITVDGSQIKCSLNAALGSTDRDIQTWLEDFKKEVLDQHLRSKISEETQGVRNLILAHAFSKTGFADNEQV